MSIPTSQEDLLGSMIPNVFIEGVTLESSGQPPEVDNPHIDHQRETIVNKDLTFDEGSLRLTVDASIKESLDDSLVGQWFGNKFSRYIKLTVLVSTHPAITAALSNNNRAITILNDGYHESQNNPSFDILRNAFKVETVGQIRNIVREHTQVKVLNIYSDVLGDDIQSTQAHSSTDSDGNTVHDINFRSTFDVRGENPSHLAVFAMTHIDMDALVDEYNLTVDETTLDAQNGKITSEIVLDSGKLMGEAFAFLTPEGKAWAGSVHARPDGTWGSYSEETSKSVSLSFTKVPNNKIQDFRNVKEIERLHTNLSVLENELLATKTKFKFLKQDNLGVSRKNAYFSELYLARDAAGNARMAFSVDYHKMLKENSVFAKLYDTPSEQKRVELLKSSRIRSLRVMRRRVNSVNTMNKLGNPISGEVLFNKDDPPKTVVSSGENQFGTFQPKETIVGGLREALVKLQNPVEGIRFFTSWDNSMSDITDGLYQYGVEMVVEDASQNYMSSTLKLLRSERKNLHKYYLEGSKLGMTKYVVELHDPHTDSKWERSALMNNSSGSYNSSTNRFSKSFAQAQMKKYKEDRERAPWVQPLLRYFSVLNMISSFSKQANQLEVTLAVGKYLHPLSGNPKGVMAVIKLMDDLISKIANMVGVETVADGSSATLMSGTSGGATRTSKVPTKTSTIIYWFTENNFDSNVIKNNGYDYLSSEVQGRRSNGLRLVTGKEYRKRVDLEGLRYFKDLNVPISIKSPRAEVTKNDSILTTGYGYLSPARVLLGTTQASLIDSSVGTTDDIYSEDQYSALECGIAIANYSSAPVYSPSTSEGSLLSNQAQLYKASMLNYCSNFNMTLTSPLLAQPKSKLDLSALPSLTYSPSEIEICEDLENLPSDDKLDPVAESKQGYLYDGIGTKNINPNSLLLEIQRDLRMSNKFYRGTTSSPFGKVKSSVSSSPANSLTSTTLQTDTIGAYNINNGENMINWMYKSEEYLNELAIVHGTNPTSVGDVIQRIPNQIKSLFVGAVNPSVVAKNWHGLGYDPITDVRSSSNFAFQHQLINRVDVLVGYLPGRSLSIKHGVWKPLTHKFWEETVGRELICRMKPYECKLFGIFRPKTLELPIYDEYFILTPFRVSSPNRNLPVSKGVFDNDSSLNKWYDLVGGTNGSFGTGSNGGAYVDPAVTTTNVVGATGASYPCDPAIAPRNTSALVVAT